MSRHPMILLAVRHSVRFAFQPTPEPQKLLFGWYSTRPPAPCALAASVARLRKFHRFQLHIGLFRPPRVFHSAEALKGASEAPPRSALWITLRHRVDTAEQPKQTARQGTTPDAPTVRQTVNKSGANPRTPAACAVNNL